MCTWLSGRHIDGDERGSYPVELAITGVDLLFGTSTLMPLFAHDLLQDGYTDSPLVENLSLVLKAEILRLNNQPPKRMSTTAALEILKDDLRALYELGYTAKELTKLIKGSLRVNATTDEVIEVLLQRT